MDTDRFLRLPQVENLIGLRSSQIYLMIKGETFQGRSRLGVRRAGHWGGHRMDGRVCARGVTDMRAAPTRYENFTAKPAQGTCLEFFFVEAFAILFGPPTLFPESEFLDSILGRRILRECAAERLADIGIEQIPVTPSRR